MFSKRPYIRLIILLFLFLISALVTKSQNLVWQELVPNPASDSVYLRGLTLNDSLYYYYLSDDRIDFWKYDEIGENWDTHISIPTDTIIHGQYLFTIKNKIYYGLGYIPLFDDVVMQNRNIWEIDIYRRVINRRGESPLYGRHVSESKGTIEGLGYIIGGWAGPHRTSIDDDFDNCYDGCWSKQFWLYDPEEDMWIQKMDLPEISSKQIGRAFAKTFIIDDELYMMGGEVNNKWEVDDYYLKDLWKYDFVQDIWIEINDDPPTYAIHGIGGNLDTLGYVGLGYPELPEWNESLENRSNKMYLYHPTTGWVETTSYPESMEDNFGFIIKGSSVGYLQTRDKLWKFSLEKITAVENPRMTGIKMYPNPTRDQIQIERNNNSLLSLSIYNAKGKVLFMNEYSDLKFSIDLSHIEAQLLIVQLMENHSFSYHKIIKL